MEKKITLKQKIIDVAPDDDTVKEIFERISHDYPEWVRYKISQKKTEKEAIMQMNAEIGSGLWTMESKYTTVNKTVSPYRYTLIKPGEKTKDNTSKIEPIDTVNIIDIAEINGAIIKYISAINQKKSVGARQEQNYYSPLETFLKDVAREELGMEIQVIQQHNHKSEGARIIPDFTVYNDTNKKIIGIVETKNIGTNLNLEEKSDQMKKYCRFSTNVILTNFYSFRLHNGNKKQNISNNVTSSDLIQLIKSFLIAKGEFPISERKPEKILLSENSEQVESKESTPGYLRRLTKLFSKTKGN